MLNIYRLAELGKESYDRLLRRSEIDIEKYTPLAREVIARVRREGDRALLYYTNKFDGVSLEKEQLPVATGEIEEAYRTLDGKTRDTLEYAAVNIRKFHTEQLPGEMWMKELGKGIMAGEKVAPLPDVCLYVPRGKGSFPSVMLMLGIPAVVAGVPRIIVCTPPGKGGKIDAATLAAAHIAGVKEIYRVGGMQAIAAVAYGTETVPRCCKVLGPGNAYVSAAKRALYGVFDVGLPAGPSEAIILADEFADPQVVSLDMLIEAEHGPDSASLLVTHGEELAIKVRLQVERLMEELPARRRSFVERVFNNYGGIVLTENLDASVEFINDYAPEHLEVLTVEPFALLPRLKNAGEILLGPCTPITLCNFVLGPNAILPTGSFARSYSGVSVHDFLKRSSFGYVTPDGFAGLKDAAAHFAEIEGFAAHALAIKKRFVKEVQPAGK
ncbi:MAG TPA: histidinol dehydrogenase [Firmicutes bacterium]|nr:histidinol dehydrogenase [Bacillota bacterium]